MTSHHLRPVPATGTTSPLPKASLRAPFTMPGTDPATVGRTRALLRHRMTSWGLPDDIRDTLELITSELVTNAVLHAPGDQVRGCLLYVPYTVTLTVITPSRPSLGITARTAADDDEHGRGLAIVEALATHWGYGSGPDGTVWAQLDITGPTPEQARPAAAEAPALHNSTPAAPTAAPDDPVAELEALVAAGQFYRLTPPWWPRRFDTRRPSADTLRAVEAGLTRLIR